MDKTRTWTSAKTYPECGEAMLYDEWVWAGTTP